MNIKKQPQEVLCKKSVIKNFGKFTGKHVLETLFQGTGLQQVNIRDWWRRWAEIAKKSRG